MAWMSLSKYVGGSVVAAGLVTYHAFSTREQFFPSVVYLATSKVAVATLGNLAFALALLVYHGIVKVFLGTLREQEIERVNERISQAVMETCLAMTIFREEFNTAFVAMFALLTFIKVFHWLVQDRVEYVESTPSVSPWQHLRIVAFMGWLLVVDALLLQYTVEKTLERVGSANLLFAFDYIILASICISVFVKYGLTMYDVWCEGRWERKGIYVFYLQLVTDLLHLVVYLLFFVIVFAHYALPLHLVRDLYWTFRNFRNRVAAFLRYRRVTANMDERFPDALPEDLARCDGVCIICREDLAAGGRNKKLPCSHVFHLHCLRSWLERQQSCPTCRSSLMRSPQQQQGGTPAQPGPGAPAQGAGAAPQQQQQQPPGVAAAGQGGMPQQQPGQGAPGPNAQQPDGGLRQRLPQAQQGLHPFPMDAQAGARAAQEAQRLRYQQQMLHAAQQRMEAGRASMDAARAGQQPGPAAAAAGPSMQGAQQHGPSVQPQPSLDAGMDPAAQAAALSLQRQHAAAAATWAAAASYGFVWNVPQWTVPASMAMFVPAHVQYAGQQQPQQAQQLQQQQAFHPQPQGMMPLLPLVLPPGLPTMPGASQHAQQDSQAGPQPQQAQQMVYTPFSGMMLPPSVVPVSGVAASGPMMMAAAAAAAAAAASAPQGTTAAPRASEAAARTNSEFMEAALEQQMGFLQAHVSALRQTRHERVSSAQGAAGPSEPASGSSPAATGGAGNSSSSSTPGPQADSSQQPAQAEPAAEAAAAPPAAPAAVPAAAGQAEPASTSTAPAAGSQQAGEAASQPQQPQQPQQPEGD